MAKYFGKIGYAVTKETAPDVYREVISEREYYGDILQFRRRWENGEYLNDNLNVDNKISIVADPFAYENFHAIRYVWWMEARWIVTNAEVQYPRLILTIGGVYNEQSSKAQ